MSSWKIYGVGELGFYKDSIEHWNDQLFICYL